VTSTTIAPVANIDCRCSGFSDRDPLLIEPDLRGSQHMTVDKDRRGPISPDLTTNDRPHSPCGLTRQHEHRFYCVLF
jgi:hypothetical protein